MGLLEPSARVAWIKCFDGLNILSKDLVALSPKRPGNQAALLSMGSELNASSNALAVYIKQKPNPKYATPGVIPGSVAGLVWLGSMASGKTTADYGEDEHFSIGWPTKEEKYHSAGLLKSLVGLTNWRLLYSNMQGGRPIRLEGKYMAIGDILTNYFRAAT